MAKKLEMWVIYERPKDFPDKFVARRWDNSRPTQDTIVENSLKEVRSKLPPWMIRFPRNESDDACIVETWM